MCIITYHSSELRNVYSFIIVSKCFIRVRFAVNTDAMTGTLVARSEYMLDGMPVIHNQVKIFTWELIYCHIFWDKTRESEINPHQNEKSL